MLEEGFRHGPSAPLPRLNTHNNTLQSIAAYLHRTRVTADRGQRGTL